MHCIGDIWRYALGLRSLAGVAARYEPERGENQRQCPNSTGRTAPAAASGRGLLPHRTFRTNQNANQAKANSVLFAEAFVPIPS
jgi:hypothetical protein